MTHGMMQSSRTSRSVSSTVKDCQAICVQTIQYCLDMGGAHVEPSHLQLMQDCADICGATAGFHLRSSQNHAGVTSACASLCNACAASCETFTDDAQMKACANQCILCASMCEQALSGASPTGVSGTTVVGQVGQPRASQQRSR